MELRIRELNPSDIREIRRIYENHFKDEFDFPDFLRGYLCAFVVESDLGIVCAAGVRTLAEVVAITNKYDNVRTRREALFKVLDASSFIAKKFGHDSLHAFVQDKGWQQHLMNRANFKPTKGQSLYLEI